MLFWNICFGNLVSERLRDACRMHSITNPLVTLTTLIGFVVYFIDFCVGSRIWRQKERKRDARIAARSMCSTFPARAAFVT